MPRARLMGWSVLVVGSEPSEGGEFTETIETFSNLLGTLDPSKKLFFAEDKVSADHSPDRLNDGNNRARASKRDSFDLLVS